MFIKAKKVIKKIFNNKQKEYDDFLEIKKNWKKEFTKNIIKNAQIEDFTNNILTIKTKNPTWKTEINFLKNEVKKNFHPVK
tara:strand:+ start:1481 stop:1723 length:243 start_codon:yes stop_codon:yes gene_type:complete